MTADRDKFEIYAANQGLRDFERNEFDDYRNPFTQQPWCFWKASRDALTQSPAEAHEIGEVTWQQAADAIENLDDYARMMVGVDPSGPRETLYRFLEQTKAALASKAQPKGMPQQQAWVWNPASLAWEAVQTPWHRHSGALYAYGSTPPDPLAVPAPAPAPEDERAAFERAWAGACMAGPKETAWTAWQARAALGAPCAAVQDGKRLDYLTGHADGLAWAADLVAMDDPRTGDWLYDDRSDLAKAIRKGPEMPDAIPPELLDAERKDAERWRAMRENLVSVDWRFQDTDTAVAIFMMHGTNACAGPEGADEIADAAIAAKSNVPVQSKEQP